MSIEGGAPEGRPVLPPADLAQMLELSRFLATHSERAVLLGADGEQVPPPFELYEVLVRVVAAMKVGKAVTVAPLSQRLTTQEAADLLGISRPTLATLLDDNQLPYEQSGTGRHRRLRLSDVLEFRDWRRVERRLRLEEMTRDAGEDGLYAETAVDYAEALDGARH